MILTSDITKAIQDAFEDDPDFGEFEIARSEFVNVNPNHCPWLGIYRQSIDYSPETLGMGPDHWTAIAVVRLVVQVSDMNSGEDCEDELEAQVKAVIDKVISDTTLSGTIDIVNEVRVSYSYVAEEEESIYFQAAIIELTLEVSTS